MDVFEMMVYSSIIPVKKKRSNKQNKTKTKTMVGCSLNLP